MKTKYLLIGILAVIVAGAVITACGKLGGAKKLQDEHGEISRYTCPMHPQIHEDHPGECPICHMSLVPVYKQEKETPLSAMEKPMGLSAAISAKRQQLIGVTKEPVKKRQLVKTIRSVGQTAFDPELAVAQREFVEIVKNVPSLKTAAVSRLKLLGMSDVEIKELEKKKKVETSLYLPQEGSTIWVYAPIYEHETLLVKIGQSVTLTLPSTQQTFEGTIRGIEPVLNLTTRSSRVRIEVPGAAGMLKPGAYLDAAIRIDLGEVLAIPKSAVIDTGVRQVAFVVRDTDYFQAVDVSLGAETDTDREVISGLKEGDIVATSAVFLLDSESRLKTAAAGGNTPSCPEGEFWDTSMSMCMPKIGE